MGVGQEKFFYELVDISSEEESELKNFIEGIVDPSIKDLCFDYIHSFAMPSKLKRISGVFCKDAKRLKESNNLIRELEVNTMEKAHGIFENLGAEFIKCRSIQEFQSLINGSTLVPPGVLKETTLTGCFLFFYSNKLVRSNFR